ncbi:hypothetical protein COL516b_006721 [Colletotrichum fioriniae]|nr:uncharacterized protein COL516b_006721 [Colletotrichum fioriniae]KAJ0303208.1 hypothetical protein COL516b_006721 [Colletotrichum fioriniae]
MEAQVEMRPHDLIENSPRKIISDVNVDPVEDAPTKTSAEFSSRKPVPRIWNFNDEFCLAALKSEWYKSLFAIQSTFFHASIDFFRGPQYDYRYLLVPLTTSSISSPMGLGSDSQPVSIELHGETTYLADSQQFLLEYALRYDDDVPGTYYVGTSCRGEDHDSTHLNQFYHVECELRGSLQEGIKVANEYIISLTRILLEKHGDTIKSLAGSTRHMTALLELATKNGGNFPTLTLDEALALPEIRHNEGIMWEYTVTGRPEYRSKARCGDFLLGLGEVVGCGNRHTTAEEALVALDHHGVDPADYAWYVDMRRLKPLETTGWGIGSERFLSWVLQHDDVRDIQLIPRLKGLTSTP